MGGSNSNTLSSAARRRMEDRMFTRDAREVSLTNSNYFNSYSSLEPDQAVRMNGDGRTLSAPDIARNTMRGHGGSNSNTLSSAARRRRRTEYSGRRGWGGHLHFIHTGRLPSRHLQMV